jgi:hypothetical protein
MGEVLLVCSLIIFTMLVIFVKKQKQVRYIHYHPRTNHQQTSTRRISRFSRDDSTIKKNSPRIRDKYYSVDSPRDTYTQKVEKNKQNHPNNFNYNIMNFYTPCILTDTKEPFKEEKKEIITEFICSDIKEKPQTMPKQVVTINPPRESVINKRNDNLMFNVMRLSDYIREDEGKNIQKTTLDLDDVSHSLSKFHSFNCVKVALGNNLHNISIKTPVREDDLLKLIIPKKIDFSTIKRDSNINESFATFQVTENKENINKN